MPTLGQYQALDSHHGISGSVDMDNQVVTRDNVGRGYNTNFFSGILLASHSLTESFLILLGIST